MRRRTALLRDVVLVVIAVALLVTVAFVERPRGPARTVASVETPSGVPAEGWTELPLPPKEHAYASFLPAGTQLILWGGCDPAVTDDCRAVAGGYAYDLASGAWRNIPDAPAPGAFAEAVWTGAEAVFLYEPQGGGPVIAQSYRPATETWRTFASPSLKSISRVVWTGAQVVAWSRGSRERPRVWKGAALDLSVGEWRRIADAPFALNSFTGMWTGSEVILFGSLLDNRNWPETKTSVGTAYSPATDSWRRLPDSELSPQATSAALVHGKVIAWDYETRYQSYDPVLDEWTRTKKMPLVPSECYPASELVRGTLFAFYCGEGALFDPITKSWRKVRGGPFRETVGAHGRAYKLWRFASTASSGEAVYFLMEGVTVSKRGVPCYGCPGSSHSFWAYRPGLAPPN